VTSRRQRASPGRWIPVSCRNDGTPTYVTFALFRIKIMKTLSSITFIVSLSFGAMSTSAAEAAVQQSCTKKIVRQTLVLSGAGAMLACAGASVGTLIPGLQFVAAPAAFTLCSAGSAVVSGAAVG
jgi:hypothetical protein